MIKKIGDNAKQEMIDCVRRCTTPAEISAECERLAESFGCTVETVYRLTKHVRPGRKTRSDKGDRVVDIRSDVNLKLVAGWVLEYGVNPAEALLMAKSRGMNIPVELETFQRYLRENGLTKKARRRNETPHRRFEASAPGEMFQFDISGLKERWFDHQTRRIISVSSLDVSKNHENSKLSRVRVWRFALIDDYSRRIFVRFVPVAKPSSSHVVDFLLQAYAELGVPKKLYTDNDAIIKYGRNKRATEILGKMLADQGGYENIFHLPGNARATGKVERLHQSLEQHEKFVGIWLKERGELSIDVLNQRFAPAVENKVNNRVHSETGEAPIARWESQFSVIRRVKYEDLKAAFAADEFTVKLRGDLTFRLKGESYQLPTADRYPFASWINQKITVVFPDELNFFTVLGLDGNEYDIVKDTSKPDAAGEWRSTAESSTEQLRKEARALARDDAKRQRNAAEPASIPFFDEDFAPAAESGNIARFPKPEVAIGTERIQEIAPGRMAANYAGTSFGYWDAYERFRSDFTEAAECKAFLDTVFPSRDGTDKFLESEIREALDNKPAAATPLRMLKAV